MNRSLTFELDAGSWKIMKPLLKEELLPDLISRGTNGTLHSSPSAVIIYLVDNELVSVSEIGYS
jgi:hypothetical protein